MSYPMMAHQTGYPLVVPKWYNNFLYKVICTWGFSPHPKRWRDFQDWFYHIEQSISFEPFVDSIFNSDWYLEHKQDGREREVWDLWHIYFTHHSSPPQYTMFLNTIHEGLLTVSRNEKGLSDPGKGAGIPTEPICERWKFWYVKLTNEIPKYGYDGREEGVNVFL